MKKMKKIVSPKDAKNKFPGYPHYPASEDMYAMATEASEVDPEDISRRKQANENSEDPKELDFDNDQTGFDLDVPGSELDDAQEAIGSEDEENNYYSIGGDNHNDLEEDKGG